MDHSRPATDDPHSRAADGSRLRGVVPVLSPFHHQAQLEQAQQDHGPDGGYSTREGGRGGLRPDAASLARMYRATISAPLDTFVGVMLLDVQ